MAKLQIDQLAFKATPSPGSDKNEAINVTFMM